MSQNVREGVMMRKKGGVCQLIEHAIKKRNPWIVSLARKNKVQKKLP
jgi:hypothetical protein